MPATPHRRAIRRTPRLASDALRGWVAVAVAALPQVALTIWASTSGMESDAVSVIGFTLVLATFHLTYLVLTWWVFGRLGPTELRHVIRVSNPRGRLATLHRLTAMDATSWVLAAVATALGVVALTLLEPATRKAPVPLLLAGVMVLLAWAVMQISATILLLRIDVTEPSLRFPDDGPIGLHDYRYVATQVLTTSATSDVSITSTAGRRAVTTLSVASMVFNTVVVALLVAAFLGLAT